MKTITTIFASVAMLGLFSVTGAYAQKGQDQPCCQAGASKMSAGSGRMFNPQTVETIRGEVIKVEETAPMRGMGHGVHLLVKTGEGTIPVHLGPAWFIDNQEIQIKPHDKVEVRGSRISFQGKPALVAEQVTVGNEVLQLRDGSGRPTWAAWRRAGGGGPAMSMTGRSPMMNPAMIERRERWMAEHKKVIGALHKLDAELNKKVEAMNEAQGPEKVDAMAATINELVKQRETIDKHIERMAQMAMARMERRQGMMMGGPGMGSSDMESSGK